MATGRVLDRARVGGESRVAVVEYAPEHGCARPPSLDFHRTVGVILGAPHCWVRCTCRVPQLYIYERAPADTKERCGRVLCVKLLGRR